MIQQLRSYRVVCCVANWQGTNEDHDIKPYVMTATSPEKAIEEIKRKFKGKGLVFGSIRDIVTNKMYVIQ